MREQVLCQLRERLRAWFHSKPQAHRRLISGGLGLVVVASLALVAAMPAITSASEVNVLSNGGFEQGFRQVNGCGVVANQWDCFTNGGAANYGFYDDQWESTVYEGTSSQLVAIDTNDMATGDNDRYAGISQTVRVAPGRPYQLSLRGMIRTSNSEGDPWRYSVQVGWLNRPQGDWRDVTNWVDVGWNTYYERTEPGAFSAFQTQLVPDAEVITVFVRVWKKWGVAYEEVDVNLDAISLTGPAVNRPDNRPHDGQQHPNERIGGIGGPVQQPGPQEHPSHDSKPHEPQPHDSRPQAPRPQGDGPQDHGPQHPLPEQAHRPIAPTDDSISCGGPDLIYNGNFEAGFVEVPWGEVGRGWEAFTNGGAANYGFYDEKWDIVVADGQHGQLIEISSKSVYPTDADRYAGIGQRIGGLHPGATYELTVRGELRGEGNEDDPYRFAAQWGLGKNTDWESVDEWTTMDLGPIAARTQPLPLAQYKVRFEAPSTSVVLFIRGWKKFAVTNVEMDLNLDAISLRACDGKAHDQRQSWQVPSPWANERSQDGPKPQGPRDPESAWPEQHEGSSCLYVVKPGDTLSQIASDHGVSMDVIIRANGISDASSIYVGQKFEIPGCKSGSKVSRPVTSQPSPAQAQQNPERPVQPYEVSQHDRPADAPLHYGPTLRPTVAERPVEGPNPQAESSTYTVQDGDMLSWIAEEHGVNAYDLAAANGIDNMNFIYTGQVLVIPN